MANHETYSQDGQDRFVAETVFKAMRNGFFVEAGAGDGLWISNTLLLERRYGWNGILVEPTSAFALLQRNRPSCWLDNSCLAGVPKTVTLVEIVDTGQASISPAARDNLLLSRTVDKAPAKLTQMDSYWGRARKQYEKLARPLADVLKAHGAPQCIDYLSLDVEGYEYEILRTFPFAEYRFGCLGIERPPQALIEHLSVNGYGAIGRVGQDTFFRPYRASGEGT